MSLSELIDSAIKVLMPFFLFFVVVTGIVLFGSWVLDVVPTGWEAIRANPVVALFWLSVVGFAATFAAGVARNV